MRSTGALAVYCGLAPNHLIHGLEAMAAPAPVEAGKTLVVIFLRGGMDGLNLIVPFADAPYYNLRSSIAIAEPGKENGALDLDGFFGLHPRAKALHPLLQSGRAVAMHAVGYDKNTRSHFEEQDTWETGVIGNTVHSDGWLNRHLLTSKGHGPIRALSIGNNLPRILQGDASAFAIKGLTDLGLPGKAADQARFLAALEHAYCTDAPEQDVVPAKDLLNDTGRDTLDATRLLQKVAAQPYEPAAAYPDSKLGKQLKEIARLIKAGVGLEVAEVDYGGWDTHNGQGGVVGKFGDLTQGLAEAVAAFNADMGDKMEDVLVVTLSDFGRTAAQNGSSGTDHGWANCMLALGGPVAAKRKQDDRPVLGTWPGLAPDQLNQKRDLLHTTDFRDVLAEIVGTHLGNENLKNVLPSHTFKPAGLIV